jgi:hypothetical protein
MTSDKPADRPAPGDVLDTPPPSAQPEPSWSGWLVSRAEVLSRIASYEWSGYECLEGDELPDDPRVVAAERIAACVRDILQHVTAIQPLTIPAGVYSIRLAPPASPTAGGGSET